MQLVDVSVPDDARLEDYRGARDPRRLRERGVFLAEGRTLVSALLRADRFRARSVLGTERALEGLGAELSRLTDAAPVYRVTPELMESVCRVRFHQGCVAAGERVGRAGAAELIAGLRQGRRRVVVLEAVTDPDNVGGIFRSAAGFGIDLVLLGPRCASPLYRKAIRTSMGATLRVPFADLERWPDDLERLRQAGFSVLGLTPEAGADIAELDPRRERIALLVGTEGYGLSAAARRAADGLVRIPMAPGVDSLNVGVAAAIAMHATVGSPGRARRSRPRRSP